MVGADDGSPLSSLVGPKEATGVGPLLGDKLLRAVVGGSLGAPDGPQEGLKVGVEVDPPDGPLLGLVETSGDGTPLG